MPAFERELASGYFFWALAAVDCRSILPLYKNVGTCTIDRIKKEDYFICCYK